MTLEGAVSRADGAFALELGTPLCGPEGQLVSRLPLVPTPGAADLGPLVGHRARVEGRMLARDASATPLAIEVRSASRL